MAFPLELTLPYPPSANRYWRAVGRRVVVSAEAREYKRGVGLLLRTLRLGKPTAKAVCLTLCVYRPRKVGDLSNRLKVLEDALEGYVYEDDEQIIEVHLYRFEDSTRPRVEVLVQER